MLRIVSWACLPSIYLLWRSVCSNLLPICEDYLSSYITYFKRMQKSQESNPNLASKDWLSPAIAPSGLPPKQQDLVTELPQPRDKSWVEFWELESWTDKMIDFFIRLLKYTLISLPKPNTISKKPHESIFLSLFFTMLHLAVRNLFNTKFCWLIYWDYFSG